MENPTAAIYESFRILQKLHMRSLAGVKTTHAQILILMTVSFYRKKHNKSPKPSDLSTMLSVSPATITPALNRLEDLGLIKRDYSKQDRRMVFVDLTEEGENQERQVSKQVGEYFNSVAEFVGEEAIAEFVDFAKKVEQFIKIEELEGEKQGICLK